MRVFDAMVVPMLLHGCETWTVQRRHEEKLQSFEIMCLRGVEGMTGMYRVRNKVVRKAFGQEAVMGKDGGRHNGLDESGRENWSN